MKVLSGEQIRRAEERGNKLGMSYEEMMEKAGTNAARMIEKRLADERYIVIICGKGKNGGDGFVVARYFAENICYIPIVILAAGEPSDEISRKMYTRLNEYNIEILDIKKDYDVAIEYIQESAYIVDAVFGIGFKGELEGDMHNVIKEINSSSAKVFSLDIPSGLECDSSEVSKNHIKADCTLTMFAPKPALVLKPSAYACGEVVVVDIGLPEICEEKNEFLFEINVPEEIKKDFQPRYYDSHKGNYGHVFSVCGSYNMPGAAVFAARAAVECGAGLVTAVFPDKAYSSIASKLNETLMLPLESSEDGKFSQNGIKKLIEEAQKASVILVGCGLGVDSATSELVYSIIKNTKSPLIIDADGINIISRNINVLKEAGRTLILTPHPGEMSRLCRVSIDEINKNRQKIAADFAREWGVYLILKGANTIVSSPEGDCLINTTGCPGMARGGSGDVLSGMLAAFMAVGLNPFRACADAVYLHGAAGEKAVKDYSELGATPSRLLDSLPLLFKNL